MDKKIITIAALCMVFALAGCGNTLNGMGRDMEGAGKWMQDKAEN